jgi:hypothetical protein
VELVHPAMSTSTEPMIALHKVICLISVEHLSLRLLPNTMCLGFAHRALQLLEQASSASVRFDSEKVLRK